MNISIIIPVYNAKDYIIDCLKSVSSQIFVGCIECILVDDCGTDNSIVLAKEYIVTYDGPVCFTILHQDHNQGPSAARNRGIREAKGEYVFFLDADDLISEDCISLLYSLAREHDLDYVQGMYHCDENYNMPVYESQDCNRPYTVRKKIKKMLLDYTYIPYTPHNRLVRRQFIVDRGLFFPEKIKVREDFYWMFFMAKNVERMALCDKVTYFRGYNGKSLTHSINKDREILAYRTLMEDFCANIDPFLRGRQKALILDALIIALNGKYYADDKGRKDLIDEFLKVNNVIERGLLKFFFSLNDGSLKSKVLHLLLRIYKRN